MERIFGVTEPFEFVRDENRPWMLLIHGFTGSPSELRRLGYALYDAGYNVKGICLPGHGSTPEEMIKTRWEDWFGYVAEAYDRLTSQGRVVIPVGHSMGGLLVLALASKRKLVGLVSVSAPIFIMSRLATLAPLMQVVRKYHPKKINVSSPILAEAMVYDRTPVPCLVSLQRAIRKTKRALPRIQAPTLIMQGGRDQTVREKSARYIYEHIGSSEKAYKYYPNSSHGILLDQDREQVFEDIVLFVKGLGL